MSLIIPKSANEFYALRDDRTNQCIQHRGYQTMQCSVRISPTTASQLTGQVMLMVAANLLSRWCRNVRVSMPPVPVHSHLGIGLPDLAQRIRSQMLDADPFGNFQIVSDDECVAPAQIELCIGDDLEPLGQSAIFINASGWLAAISMAQHLRLPHAGDSNALGAIVAACLGVAQMFKISIEAPESNYFREGIFDLFKFEWAQDGNVHQHPWPSVLDVGNLLMVGAGSVGSSAAFCMDLVGISGHLTIVDSDVVKIENLNRSPLFSTKMLGLTKANALAQYLETSSLHPTAVSMWWAEFVQNRSTFEYDAWLPLANEFGVRRSMQVNVPPLMIHASTTSDWGANHGRHIPGRDDCLCDRFPPDIAEQPLTCSTGKLLVRGNQVDAALPFISLFAGSLIAADLVRLQLPGYPQIPNFAFFDWHGCFETIQTWNRQPDVGCICQQQTVPFHIFNRNSKYWHLFGFETPSLG